jgi:hypothetical protein
MTSVRASPKRPPAFRGGTPRTHSPLSQGNYYSYNWALAEAFSADLIPIAWSGKGMYENCCDNGETMPSYYLQTLGGAAQGKSGRGGASSAVSRLPTPAGNAYSTDWDFLRYVPDMMLINLGWCRAGPS